MSEQPEPTLNLAWAEAVTRPWRGKRTYTTWQLMLRRCRSPKSSKYRFYGGRGIRVCKRWTDGTPDKHPYLCFVEDMGPRPAGMTLDRKDSNGHYTPANCRWATPVEQAANRRKRRIDGGWNRKDSRRIRCFSGPRGEKSVPEWAFISGIPAKIIGQRLRSGWCAKHAVFGRLQ